MKDRVSALHFIGAGGVGVNSLAKFALTCGIDVSASDLKSDGLLDELEANGARIWVGDRPDKIGDADAVVYSSAVRADDPELKAAVERGIPVYERHVALGAVSRCFSRSVGVAGTHGKTTTTAMLAHILSAAGMREVAMIGGISHDFSNFHCNFDLKPANLRENSIQDAIFVTEACEYRHSFLSLEPTVGVVTNMECDHPDCYKDIYEVEAAFGKYLENSAIKILPSNLSYLIDGVLSRDDVRANFKDIERMQEIMICRSSGRDCVKVNRLGDNVCELWRKDAPLCKIELGEDGDYNLFNAAFATVAAMELGVAPEAAAKSLKNFGGVSRRYERAGEVCGVPVYFDFAHHPTEIECVLRRAAAHGKALVVFQPHTFSRTKAYLTDFVRVLTDEHVGTLILLPAYSARECEEDGLDSAALLEAIKSAGKCDAIMLPASDVAAEVGIRARGHGIVLFIGAGDIYALKGEFSHTGQHFSEK